MPLTDEAIVGLAQAVVAVLGVEEDVAVQLRARAQVQVMNRQVFSYTRGQGYDAAGVPNPDICSVLISAVARWASNPAMSDSESESAPIVRASAAGSAAGVSPAVMPDGAVLTESHSFSGFQGFTELELKILHGYRKRNG